MEWQNDDPAGILRSAHTVAVVGLSHDPSRPSYSVARYLQEQGYRIIPVNPQEREVLDEPAYPDLTRVPLAIDVVDVFRRAEFVPDIVDQAIQVGAKAVWLQLGIEHLQAAQRARQAGLKVVMDRCMAIELRKLPAKE